jgi:hypothetical protein
MEDLSSITKRRESFKLRYLFPDIMEIVRIVEQEKKRGVYLNEIVISLIKKHPEVANPNNTQAILYQMIIENMIYLNTDANQYSTFKI